jgi:hypothetical protein
VPQTARRNCHHEGHEEKQAWILRILRALRGLKFYLDPIPERGIQKFKIFIRVQSVCIRGFIFYLNSYNDYLIYFPQ